ncbi:hypothetical protein ZIOFF_000942 [Zingiber officinale]|uniref:UBC core domain-containing protein n=1 Tax=Zingiber officinale TaxID=94328 RepID=A0A8J5I1M6_ZINOF|nr:hypothetical protein ZIOFF_000942 [Zingiber officinale]
MAVSNPANLLLQKQLRDLMKNPVDGFSAGLVDDSNVFEWNVTIIGPPDTLYIYLRSDSGIDKSCLLALLVESCYENAVILMRYDGCKSHCSDGGFFNAIMSFPPNYPNSPPSVRFTSEMWHPNVYPDGRVCISILHPPGEDPNGYELPSERWTPIHTLGLATIATVWRQKPTANEEQQVQRWRCSSSNNWTPEQCSKVAEFGSKGRKPAAIKRGPSSFLAAGGKHSRCCAAVLNMEGWQAVRQQVPGQLFGWVLLQQQHHGCPANLWPAFLGWPTAQEEAGGRRCWLGACGSKKNSSGGSIPRATDFFVGGGKKKGIFVESIVLSIISMLSSPNDESPANVEAAVSQNMII